MECKYQNKERPWLYFMVFVIFINTCSPLERNDLRQELKKTNQKLDSILIFKKNEKTNS